MRPICIHVSSIIAFQQHKLFNPDPLRHLRPLSKDLNEHFFYMIKYGAILRSRPGHSQKMGTIMITFYHDKTHTLGIHLAVCIISGLLCSILRLWFISGCDIVIVIGSHTRSQVPG